MSEAEFARFRTRTLEEQRATKEDQLRLLKGCRVLQNLMEQVISAVPNVGAARSASTCS